MSRRASSTVVGSTPPAKVRVNYNAVPNPVRMIGTYLELEFLHLPIQVLRQILPRRRLHLIHSLLSPNLEAIAVLREGPLDKVDTRIEERLHRIYPTNSFRPSVSPSGTRQHSPSNVKALAQSAISFSLTKRSNVAGKYPSGTEFWGEAGRDGLSLSTAMVAEGVAGGVAVESKQRKQTTPWREGDG